MKLRVFDTIATPPPPKKKLSESQKNLFLFNICRFFFLTLSNKQNEMSGDHDRRTQGGKSRRSPGGGGVGWHERINKTIPCGCMGVPLWGYFSMWAVFSLHVEAIFSVCCGRYFWSAPPLIFFAGTPLIVITFFFTSQIFICLPDRGSFNFFRKLIFFFS